MSMKDPTIIRQVLGENIQDVARLLLDNSGYQTYDDLYVGKVINNNDLDKEGKCQIRVYGVFGNDIPDEDLPWALPENTFVGSKKGSFVVPPVGAIVRVFFDHDDIYLPHYTTKVTDLNNVSTLKDEDYPDTMVLMETDEGDYVTVNRKTGKIVIKQRKGIKITLATNGDVMIEDGHGNVIAMEDDDVTLHSEGTVRIDANTKVVLGSGGGYVVTSPAPGQIVTQDGHVLDAVDNVIA